MKRKLFALLLLLSLVPSQHVQAHGTNCDLGDTAAFCDTFDQPFGGTFGNGGRTGALNPSRWGVSRMSGNQDPNQGSYNKWRETPAQFCTQTIYGVKPDGDFYMCGPEFGESMHFMEAMHDDDNYVYNSAKILQPFDFTNRTGTFTFDVDAKTNGGHSWWIEVWLTDQPVNAPHTNNTHAFPRNGVGFAFSDNCGIGGPVGTEDGGGCTRGGLNQVVTNFSFPGDMVPWGTGSPKLTQVGQITTARDRHNHFVVKINKNRAEVWATDAVGHGQDAVPKLISYTEGLNLPFEVGWLHFQHAHYSAAKFDAAPYQTYHWDNIGFDGPVRSGPRQYMVKDALTPAGPERINLGYKVISTGMELGPQTIPGVDLSGATSAYLLSNSFQTRWEWQLNGGAWHQYQSIDPPGDTWGVLQQYVPVSLSDLRQGDNTVNFRMTNPIGIVSNVDLLVFTDGQSPTSTPTPVATSTPTVMPTNTLVPTTQPTITSTPVPTATQVPTVEPTVAPTQTPVPTECREGGKPQTKPPLPRC